CASSPSRPAARCCFRRVMSSSRRARSPTGYSRTGCRYACRSSCTNTCGATCRGSSVDGSAAVVLLSGGLDSATVLAIAREQGFTCHALSVDYGQRHAAELEAARRGALAALATRAGVEGSPCRVHTPLIALTKAEIVREGARLGVDYSQTVSCYQADAEGRACGRCDACRLRRAGFAAAGLPDPTRYQRP